MNRSEPGPGRQQDERGKESPSLVRHEEEARIGKEWREAGRVRAIKSWETHEVTEDVPRRTEVVEGMERQPVQGEDSGEVETLPDGSISIPVFEEELVVSRRLVVKERVIVRKHEEVREETVRAELGRERIEIQTEGDAEVTGDIAGLEQSERDLPHGTVDRSSEPS